MTGKGAYLKKITSLTLNKAWRSVNIGEKMDGVSPPSVFVGKANYPKVYVGPMIVDGQLDSDKSLYDTPERWLLERKTQEDIIGFRLELVRGKYTVGINDIENKFVQKMQEIALSKKSVESEAKFAGKPRGISFNEDNQPYGPSGFLTNFDIGNTSWEQKLEKAFYDTDLKANDAIATLYDNEVLFSQIQKAFSVGTFGQKRNRKLVPTRWSITAVDDALGKHLFDEVRYKDLIEKYQIYEYRSLNNYYAVLLTPTPWQYEWLEAFIGVLGEGTHIFADRELFKPKKEYSSVGGCYYSCKFAVLEALARMKKQGGAIVFREAYEDYIPLGVFNVRENVRSALLQKPREFDTFRQSLNYISTKLRLPISKFVEQGVLIRQMLDGRQTRLVESV